MARPKDIHMPGIYPLNPVITSNPAFASLYDMHPLSLYLISECLTPSEAARLLDEGAVFDTVVLLGGEGKGLHELTRKRCDFVVSLPTVGPVKSLNVSVAAGVVLFEAVRQRKGK